MQRWGKLMNDELAGIAGKYEELVGKLQERYGIAKEESRQQVNEFKRTVAQLKKSNEKLMELQKSLRKNGKPSKKLMNVKKPSRKRLRPKTSG